MSAAHPDAWARDKRSKARAVAEGPAGGVLLRATAVLAPGAPVAAWAGVCCNGSRDENTTGWITCSEAERAEAERTGQTPLGRKLDAYARRGLHELGRLGVEALKAPALVAGPGSPWRTGAVAPGVVKVLGREGVTEPGAWHGRDEDQIVIGVWNNAVRHGKGVRARLDPRLRWDVGEDGNPKRWTLWPFALCTMAWSAGDGGAARHVNRYAEDLLRLPEELRWGGFVRAASTYRSGQGYKHGRPSYSALRTCQKLAAAALAVEYTGEGPAALEWLDEGLPDREAVLEALVRSAAP